MVLVLVEKMLVLNLVRVTAAFTSRDHFVSSAFDSWCQIYFHCWLHYLVGLHKGLWPHVKL